MKKLKYTWEHDSFSRLTVGQVYDCLFEGNEYYLILCNDCASRLFPKYQFEEVIDND